MGARKKSNKERNAARNARKKAQKAKKEEEFEVTVEAEPAVDIEYTTEEVVAEGEFFQCFRDTLVAAVDVSHE